MTYRGIPVNHARKRQTAPPCRARSTFGNAIAIGTCVSILYRQPTSGPTALLQSLSGAAPPLFR
jgi:hypothetical protein